MTLWQAYALGVLSVIAPSLILLGILLWAAPIDDDGRYSGEAPPSVPPAYPKSNPSTS
jgi:hypothetical protein